MEKQENMKLWFYLNFRLIGALFFLSEKSCNIFNAIFGLHKKKMKYFKAIVYRIYFCMAVSFELI